ncbi:glycerophosphoryl diester phosphodiesterase [Eubacterium aggregans]|uniref:Glycerophosphoryl diester phosphodiesterase n=2 Tax=Eubacterium aggregans TaxID=81409 RepID=A0A1H3WQ61_9FIRM|nr:glycerophosphoryl diester phosphodiesterase [Eubacterium aggregans]
MSTQPAPKFLRGELRRYALNFWPLLLFEMLYYTVGSFGLKPLNGLILNKALLYANLNYLQGSNLTTVASNPLVIAAALLLLFLNAFFILLEFTTVILCLYESHNGRRVQLFPLIATGIRRAAQIFEPKNWIAILFLLLILPFVDFGLSSNYFHGITIPGFIMSYIYEAPVLTLAFVALTLLLFLLALRILYAFHFFTLKGDSFIKSALKSHRFIHKHLIQTLWRCIAIRIILILIVFFTVLAFLIFFAIVLGISGALGALIDPHIALSTGNTILLAFLALIGTLGLTAVAVIETPLILAVLTASFYQWSPPNTLPTEPIVPERPLGFWTRPRKIILCVLVLLVAFGGKYLAVLGTFNGDTLNTLFSGPLIAGHRGNSTETPENTRAALEKAIAEGADYVEIDVCQTADGVLVISHDSNLSRLTGVDINIWETNYADLKDLDIGSHFSPEFSNERLMTLDEAIDLCDGRIKMNIELKPTAHDVDFVKHAVAVFQKHNFYNKGFFASLDYDTLKAVEEMDPQIKTCLNTFIALGNLELLPVDIYSVEATFATEDLLTRVHNADKQLWVWTVDDEDQIDKIVELGVDAIVTDSPGTAQTYIKENAPNQSQIFFSAVIKLFSGL